MLCYVDSYNSLIMFWLKEENMMETSEHACAFFFNKVKEDKKGEGPKWVLSLAMY